MLYRSEGTDVEVCTAARDGHSNMSVLSQLETESEVGAGILEYTVLLYKTILLLTL